MKNKITRHLEYRRGTAFARILYTLWLYRDYVMSPHDLMYLTKTEYRTAISTLSKLNLNSQIEVHQQGGKSRFAYKWSSKYDYPFPDVQESDASYCQHTPEEWFDFGIRDSIMPEYQESMRKERVGKSSAVGKVSKKVSKFVMRFEKLIEDMERADYEDISLAYRLFSEALINSHKKSQESKTVSDGLAHLEKVLLGIINASNTERAKNVV